LFLFKVIGNRSNEAEEDFFLFKVIGNRSKEAEEDFFLFKVIGNRSKEAEEEGRAEKNQEGPFTLSQKRG
jgi:hypothetical protein